jgi:hypothetical protein
VWRGGGECVGCEQESVYGQLFRVREPKSCIISLPLCCFHDIHVALYHHAARSNTRMRCLVRIPTFTSEHSFASENIVYSLRSSQYILPSALVQRICARCPCCDRQLCVQITCTWRLIGTVAVTVVSDWSIGSVKRKRLENGLFSDRVSFFHVRSPRAGLHTQRRKPRLEHNPAIFHLPQVVAVSMVPVFFLRFRNLSALLLPPDPFEPVYGKSRSVRVAMTSGCRVLVLPDSSLASTRTPRGQAWGMGTTACVQPQPASLLLSALFPPAS